MDAQQGLQSFEADLDRFSKQVEVELHKVIKLLSMFVLRGVVMKTPVDTGRARASWNVGVNYQDLSVAPKTREGIGASAATQKAISSGTERLGRLDASDSWPVVYVTNNLPYIQRLEDGWSEVQAPNGMVKLTLAEAEQYLLRILR